MTCPTACRWRTRFRRCTPGLGRFRVSPFTRADPSYVPAPTLRATPANAAVTLEWTPVPVAFSYSVFSARTPNGPWVSPMSVSGAFNNRLVYTTGLLNGEQAFFRVEANASSLSSVGSNVVSATPPAINGDVGNAAADITWSAVSGATSYRVLRRLPGRGWKPLVTVTVPGWRDFNLENGEDVDYAVEAQNAQGSGAMSAPISRQPIAAKPEIPENVRIRPANAAVFVEWERVPGATTYTLTTSASANGSFTSAGTTVGEFETRRLVSTTNGSAAFVKITANNGSGSSLTTLPVSSTATNTLPATPSCSVTTAGSGAALVSWGVSAGATSYKVYRRLQNTDPTEVANVMGTSFNDSGLTAGATYVYYMEPQNMTGAGAWSLPASFVVP